MWAVGEVEKEGTGLEGLVEREGNGGIEFVTV